MIIAECGIKILLGESLISRRGMRRPAGHLGSSWGSSLLRRGVCVVRLCVVCAVVSAGTHRRRVGSFPLAV